MKAISPQGEIPNKKVPRLSFDKLRMARRMVSGVETLSRGAVLLLVLLCVWTVNCFSQNCITIDFINRKIELADFSFKNLNVKGDFLFDIKREDGSLIFNLDGKNVWLKSKSLSWLKLRLTKKGETIFIHNFSSPEFMIKGKFNLVSRDLFFDINVNSCEKHPLLEGKISAKVKVWGRLGNYLTSGSINIADGRYQGVEFLYLMLNFLGKPPLLNLTDSEVILKDGSSYKIEGLLNLKDLNNLFPDAEFISQKVSFGEWKLLAQEKTSVSLKKEINDKFDILLDASEKEGSPVDRGTELRYKIQDDKFLKLRMEDDKSILGLERRKEF